MRAKVKGGLGHQRGVVSICEIAFSSPRVGPNDFRAAFSEILSRRPYVALAAEYVRASFNFPPNEISFVADSLKASAGARHHRVIHTSRSYNNTVSYNRRRI
jgi:hypothetical protein